MSSIYKSSLSQAKLQAWGIVFEESDVTTSFDFDEVIRALAELIAREKFPIVKIYCVDYITIRCTS